MYLERACYTVDTALNASEGIDAARCAMPNLMVLDLSLPLPSELEAYRALQTVLDVPIIMLSTRTLEQDTLARLDLGENVYTTKSFNPRELVSRVRTALRSTAEEDRGTGFEFLSYRDLTLDTEGQIFTVGGREVHLTVTEFRLMEVLMGEPGRVFSRSQLVDKVLGYDYDGLDRTIDVHVFNLRRKIEAHPSRYGYLVTVYGRGYKFAD